MASTSTVLRRPSRPSQAGRPCSRMARRKSSSAAWWPRMSLTAADVALAFWSPPSLRTRVGSGLVQIGADQQILFDGERAFGAAELDAARIAGKNRCSRDERAEGAVGKFQESYERVFGFDFVQLARPSSACTAVTSPQSHKQQIHRVHALIHQRAAAIERGGAAPFRAAVIFRRAPPFHARFGQDGLAENSAVEQGFHAAQIGL
jgi:hypothetical protein